METSEAWWKMQGNVGQLYTTEFYSDFILPHPLHRFAYQQLVAIAQNLLSKCLCHAVYTRSFSSYIFLHIFTCWIFIIQMNQILRNLFNFCCWVIDIAIFQSLSEPLRSGCTFSVNTVFWNLGINHEATFSQSIAGDSSLEPSINLAAVKALASHASTLKDVSHTVEELVAELTATVKFTV